MAVISVRVSDGVKNGLAALDGVLRTAHDLPSLNAVLSRLIEAEVRKYKDFLTDDQRRALLFDQVHRAGAGPIPEGKKRKKK